jgi:DNA-binding transcriptional ArsR family regulator
MHHSRASVHAHPLRDRLLAEYAKGPASPSAVARRIGQRLNLVSYHTQVLLEHGFVELVRTEQRRGGTAHFYRSTVAPVIEDDTWATLPTATRRKLVRELLATIAEESRDAALRGGFDPGHAHLTRWPMLLDEADRAQVSTVLRGLLDDFDRIQAESDCRGAGVRQRFDVVLMAFPDQSESGGRS